MISVCICTYKRPEGLRRLLEAMSKQSILEKTKIQIIIVDNDGSSPEVAEIVAAHAEEAPYHIELHVESVPGISAARNKALAISNTTNVTAIAMIDDDEWPSDIWLEQLYDEMESANSDIVGGPVQPVFSTSIPKSLSDFWAVRKLTLRGKVIVYCTCNFLMRRSILSVLHGVYFDEKYGLTGGGDAVFFRRLFNSGAIMSWCETALVYEEVPPTRANIKWLRSRYFRKGNHSIFIERVDTSAFISLLKTVLQIFRLPFFPVLSRSAKHILLSWNLEAHRVAGRCVGHLGAVYAEYKRK